jgi:aminomethyltransferase
MGPETLSSEPLFSELNAMSENTPVRRTPLYDAHLAADGKLVEFAGWQMPVQYSGVLQEHRAVRTAAGLFDVSHMGEFRVSGEGAEAFLQGMTPNDVAKLKPGRIHYSGLLTERGTYVDDLLVYRLAAEEFLLVVNAANAEKDFAWLAEHNDSGVTLEDVSSDYGLIAVQGPKAEEILSGLTTTDLAAIRYYAFVLGEVDSRSVLISRTGYTGEDGFELYLPPEDTLPVWNRLLEEGGPEGLVPAGLGARDTLRMEAAMALYGHEIDDTITPLEARLQWVVKLQAADFIGRQALVEIQERGLSRRLVGFRVEGRGIARQGHKVVADGEAVGFVTSGTFSPTLEKALGMAYVPVSMAASGTSVSLDIRGKRVPAVIVDLPFYKRAK